jgi:uncharacterized protein (TIGR02466 family)
MRRFALFETPVASYPDAGDAEHDRELVRRLVEESTTSPGLQRSNTGGWHSVPDLSMRPEPCFQHVMNRVLGGVQMVIAGLAGDQNLTVSDLRYRYSVQGWAMVMRDGDYNVVHDHAHAHFSTAYYPDAGDADLEAHPQSGLLTFVDPRRTGAALPGVDLYPAHFSLVPHTGTLVVFPGWLQHFVHTYRGTRPRVSISCNVRVEMEVAT